MESELRVLLRSSRSRSVVLFSFVSLPLTPADSFTSFRLLQTEGTYGDVTWYGFKRITRVRISSLGLEEGTRTLTLFCPTRRTSPQVPIDRRLVDASLLSPDEKKWIRDHNELCRTDILPLLKGKENQEAREWLKKC